MATTTSLLVNSTTFTDLGAAPTQIQVIGPAAVTVAVADTLPAVGAVGFVLQGNQGNGGAPITIQPADASSHCYVAMFGGLDSEIVYCPVYVA